MSGVLFFFFTLFMAGLLYMHFYFAHSQWRQIKGQQPSDIDSSYVKREDYFAQSFRSKLRLWLELPGVGSPRNGGRTIVKGPETIQVHGQLCLPDNTKSDNILVAEEDFACGSGCELSREIRTYGKADIGPRSRLQAIAADGDLSLGDKVRVARWADSLGELRVGRSCKVLSRITSQKAVRLEMGAEALSIFAPEVTTERERTSTALVSASGAEPLQIPPEEGADNSRLKKLGFDRDKLSPLGTACWVYSGSLRPHVPLRITGKLIVKGDCVCPPGSVIESDLKATGSLSIRGASRCGGNLIAEKWLYLGPGVEFGGVLRAGGEVLLSRRVRGQADGALVGAQAGLSLFLEGEVTVRGILAAGERVRVIPSGFAEEWRRRHKADRQGT